MMQNYRFLLILMSQEILKHPNQIYKHTVDSQLVGKVGAYTNKML